MNIVLHPKHPLFSKYNEHQQQYMNNTMVRINKNDDAKNYRIETAKKTIESTEDSEKKVEVIDLTLSDVEWNSDHNLKMMEIVDLTGHDEEDDKEIVY